MPNKRPSIETVAETLRQLTEEIEDVLGPDERDYTGLPSILEDAHDLLERMQNDD